jgi:predicted ATPase/DNA-binding SARP family transcriptional activator
VEFRILGTVDVVDDDGTVLSLGGPKPRAILALMLLAEGAAQSRDRLADELWEGDPPPTATSALHVHLTTLRRALKDRVRTTPGGYVIDVADGEVDARLFERAIAAAPIAAEPQAISADLRAALALWRGPALGGAHPTPALIAASARLEELRVEALERRVDADLSLGRHADLVAELTEEVGAHRGRERLVGQLMLALHRCGRSADALTAYDLECDVLKRELGVDPADELVALAKAIRRGDPAIGAAGPPSLPTPASSFIGRRHELDEATALAGSGRLLTLVGPPGAGKTRLAIELARSVASDHPDGVHLVELAQIPRGGTPARALVAVVGARVGAGQSLVDAVIARLRHRRALLVLDNCEHVITQCASLTVDLLAAAPGLRIVATSRTPLGIDGESAYEVEGLGVSRPDAVPERARSCDAMRLLETRVAAARGGRGLAHDEVTAALDVCRRLDGLPLAIELAAARMRTMSVAEVGARLEDRFEVLPSSSGAPDARHRTMVAAIDWSHDLLTDRERVLYRRLGVVASADMDMVETVACDTPDGLLPTSGVLDAVTGLCDQSLVIADTATASTRYRMLSVVRQHALHRLVSAGEDADIRRRHAAYLTALVVRGQQLLSQYQRNWLDRLLAVGDDIRAALHWLLGAGAQPAAAVRLAGYAWWLWITQGLHAEGRAWLERALAAAPDAAPDDRVRALRAAGALARHMGDLSAARSRAIDALALARTLDDDRLVGPCLNSLAYSLTALGDLAAARPRFVESLAVAERLGDVHAVGTSLNNLSVLDRASGDLDAAEALLAQAREAVRGGGFARLTAVVASNAAILARRRGDPARSRALALEALAGYDAVGFIDGELDCVEAIAIVDGAAGHPVGALRLLDACGRERDVLALHTVMVDAAADRALARAAAVRALDADELSAVGTWVAAHSFHDAVRALLSNAAVDL